MRRRLFVLAAVVVALIGAAGVWLVLSRSVVAEFVRAQAEARLAAALGQPVTIGNIGVTFGPRPAFTGSDIRIGSTDREAPALHLDSIRLVPRIGSLLSDTIEIDAIRLDGFTVSILRDRNGRWHAPAVFPAPTEDETSGVAIDRVRVTGGRLRIFDERERGGLAESSSIDDISADMLIDPAGLRLAPLSGRIGDAAIEGEAQTDARSVRLAFNAPAIADADLPVVFGLLGGTRPAVLRLGEAASVSVTVTIDRATSRLGGSGKLTAPAMTVEPLELQQLEAPFAIDGSRLTFTPTTFVLNRGAHTGRFTLALDADPPRWSSDSRMDGLDFGALLDTIAGRDAKLDGTGRLESTLRGRIEAGFLNRMEGTTRLSISDGVLHDFPLLATINRTLRLAEVESNDTRFERLTATLTLAGGVATTDDLVLEAEHLRVTSAGRIGFDRSIDLRGVATISADRAAAAVDSVHELARLRNARGEMELPLTMTGTLDAPKFGLDLQAAIKTGILDELQRRLRRLLPRE